MTRPSIALFVHPSDEMYGADRILLEVLKQVDPQGAVVWLPDDLPYPERRLSRVLSDKRFDVRRMPLPVLRRAYLRLGRMPWLMLRTIRSTIHLFALRPRLVYLNTSACLPLAPVARASGARVIVHIHETWGRTELRLLGCLLSSAHEVVVVSEATRDLLPIRAQRRARVVHNGLPTPSHDVAPPSSTDAQLTFLVASRWLRWKGHATLLDAWDRLTGNARLVILGGPPPIGDAVDVLQLVARMRRATTVEVVGEVDDLGAWFARADCVVVPSAAPDPLPTIAIEAAAHARAVIASRCGGLPEIVEDGVTGVLVEPGDPVALATALAAFTAENAQIMGEAARLRFERSFSADRFGREIGEVLDFDS